MLKGKKKQLAMLLVALGLYSQANAVSYVNTLSTNLISSMLSSFDVILKTDTVDSIKSKDCTTCYHRLG